MKQLLIRSLGGLIVVGAIILSVYNEWAMLLVAMLIAAGSMLEVFSIARRKGIFSERIVPILFSMLALIAIKFDFSLRFLVLLLPVVAIIELYRNKVTPLENICVSVGNVIYVLVPMLLLIFFRESIDRYFLLAYFVIVWTNDVGAYLVGMSIGKHRLFERISPKKSWEGFWGGVLFSVAVSLIAGYMIHNEVSLWWAGLGVIISVSGVWGDLIESMFKRSVQMKDSGSIIPGHGGFLDRFDAVFVSAPIVFIYLFVTNQNLF
jgi:phosphatidate cytidylyltransferase